MTNDEVRRMRLEQLIQMVDGGLGAIAAGVDTHPQYLDHILKRRMGAKRADGTRRPVAMGDELARRIEESLSLPTGWMDWPFPNVPYERYAALDDTRKALVQGQMLSALSEAEKLTQPAVLQQVNRPAVTNAKVEKHYKAAPKKAPAKKSSHAQEAGERVHNE